MKPIANTTPNVPDEPYHALYRKDFTREGGG